LVLDLLAIYMIRDPSGSTIISYHPSGAGFTSAKDLCSRVHIGVRNPQWSTLLNEGRDPTVVLLIFLWHVMYSWDEALQRLYLHIDTLVSALSLEVGEANFDSIIPLPSGDRRLKEDRKEKHGSHPRIVRHSRIPLELYFYSPRL